MRAREPGRGTPSRSTPLPAGTTRPTTALAQMNAPEDKVTIKVTVTHGVTTLYTGALKNMGTLAGPGTVATGGTDAITFLFSLPVSAGNTFQTLTQDLTVTYTGTQLAGTAR